MRAQRQRSSMSVPRAPKYSKLINGLVLSAGMVLAFLTASPVEAQTKIEQMIVTAQKRAQDIQAVPASISAFSGETLEQRQIKNIENVLQATPNVTWTAGPSNTPNISIRGVGPEAINGTVDPSIGFHVDGVYQPRTTNVLRLMNDVDSIEVLRGPQGTLYGRNANAGVINLNTKRPTDSFEASGTLFGGSYEHYGARGYVSGPVISDKVEMRVSGVLDRHSGWGKNIITGARPEADYFQSARISLRLKPIEDVTVDLIASYSKDHNNKQRYTMSCCSGANYNTIVADGGGAFTTEPFRTNVDVPPEQTHLYRAATGIINWDIAPNFSLKSISGVQRSYDEIIVDVDTLNYPFVWSRVFGRGCAFSQEFNLTAKLWDRLDAVVGLYYLRDHSNSGTVSTFQKGFPSPSLAPNAPLGTYTWNSLNLVAESKAAFVDTTLSITDELRLLAGIRRTLDSKNGTQNQFTWSPVTGVSGPCQSDNPVPELAYHSTTGKLGLQYDFTPEIMGYVQWQNGFKTGGFNSSVCRQSFNPEKIRSWEVGVKSTLFDDTMSLNISLFSYNYQDLQLSRVVGISSVVDNAAKAKIKGGEIESVVNFTDDLRADIGIGFLHSEYKGYSGVLVAGGPLVSTDGNQLAKAPNFTMSAGLEYTFRLGDFGDLKSRAEMYHSSRIYYTPFNEPASKQDGYTIGNLYFTLTPDNSPYQFQAYVKNVTNKAYKSGGSSSSLLTYAYGQWGDPRLFGVEATVKF